MTPDANAWEAAAGVGVGGVVIFISTVAFALRRLGIGTRMAPSTPPAPASQDVEQVRESVARLERELSDHRLTLAEHYLRRDDWVPTTSRVLGLLEQHSVALARLEERSLSIRRTHAE